MNIIEKTIPSTDNIHNLYVKIFVPNGEIKGVFQIVHGMTEHIERYEPLMAALCDIGYVAFGHNHLGHKFSSPDDELGFISKNGGYKILIDDVVAVGTAVKAEFSAQKHILFGHSMGSFVVRMAATNFKDSLDKLIICGTGGPNPAASMGIGICSLVKAFKGEKHISKLVYSLAFGSYNKRFGGSRNAWLSTNRQNIEIYEKDKYCTFKFTVSAMKDLITLNKNSNTKQWFRTFPKNLPTLLIAGREDPVGNYGKGVETVYNNLKAEGANVNIKLYENMRHEILNEDKKETVIADIINFAEEK